MTWLVWALGAFLSFAVLEALALHDKVPGTTLSANVWAIRSLIPVRVGLWAGLSWLTWHLLSPLDTRTGGWDDVLVIVIGAVIGLAVRYKPRTGA